MKYRLKEDICFLQNVTTGEFDIKCTYFMVQVKFLCFWITVKEFVDEDIEYSYNCAKELLDNLVEDI